MDIRFVDLEIVEDLLNSVRSTTEDVLEKLFETGTSTSERSCGSRYNQLQLEREERVDFG